MWLIGGRKGKVVTGKEAGHKEEKKEEVKIIPKRKLGTKDKFHSCNA